MTFEPSGWLAFDKPKDWTSHDVVDAVRRAFPKGTKVGHTGTLDPLATGLLVILVGRATRAQASLQGLDKVYSGEIKLGVSTDTGDITGKTLGSQPVPPLTPAQIQEALDCFKGAVELPAPAYSAVKHQGKPLYKYARQGVAVPEKMRSYEIYDWRAVSYADGLLSHRLHCSSGTYVRSLAEAVGRALGCGATVQTLRRERIGEFSLEGALTLDALKAGAKLEPRPLPALRS